MGFGGFVYKGRPTGSTGYLSVRTASWGLFVDGLCVRATYSSDVDEAVLAERLDRRS